MHGMNYTGFSTSFIYAGIPSVVSIIRNVKDKSKANFMDIIFSILKKNKVIADSLSAAQIESVMTNKK